MMLARAFRATVKVYQGLKNICDDISGILAWTYKSMHERLWRFRHTTCIVHITPRITDLHMNIER